VLKEVLKRERQLHEALQCTLDKVDVELKDGAFSMVYTDIILNKDQDAICVLDPEKFHPAIFHDFNNGAAMQNLETGEYNRY
jgi:hypothetical protein